MIQRNGIANFRVLLNELQVPLLRGAEQKSLDAVQRCVKSPLGDQPAEGLPAVGALVQIREIAMRNAHQFTIRQGLGVVLAGLLQDETAKGHHELELREKEYIFLIPRIRLQQKRPNHSLVDKPQLLTHLVIMIVKITRLEGFYYPLILRQFPIGRLQAGDLGERVVKGMQRIHSG